MTRSPRTTIALVPLPLQTCADDVPTDVCCTSIFDVADRLRAIACTAVESCIHPSCNDRCFESYCSIGPSVPEPLGDALIVHMPDMTPSPGSRSNTGNTLLGVSLQHARFDIFLTENGWPTAETDELGNVIEVPDRGLINAIARHAYSHGERMYRAVLDSYQKHVLFPPTFFPYIHKADISGLRPVQPAAFTVGWTISVTVQMTFPPLFLPSTNVMIDAPVVTSSSSTMAP